MSISIFILNILKLFSFATLSLLTSIFFVSYLSNDVVHQILLKGYHLLYNQNDNFKS